MIKSVFLTLSCGLGKKIEKKTAALEDSHPFFMVPERAALSAHGRKLTHKQRNGKEKTSGRRSLTAGRKITARNKWRCSCQQVIQGQCPQTLYSKLFCCINFTVSHISRSLWDTALWILNSLAFWMLQHETKKGMCFFFLTFH